MRERIFSLETEYAISFQAESGGAPESEEIVEVLRRPLIQKYGIASSMFLINGSKFHHDVGHAEWSLPECRSAREAVVYDKAADHMLGTVIPQAEQRLAARGHYGKLLVIKNNVDTEGHTYGCHENYMAESETQWLGREDHLRLTIRCLVPFLVTRQIFCGVGRVGFGQCLEEGFGFQIMQRADFIDSIVSKETRSERAVVNIGREAEPLAAGNYRRLHLILADANLSGWATYLKLGTTGLVLRMVEDLGFGDIPHLCDPLNALQRISRDPSCKTRVNLRDGRELTAVEIQRIYLEQVRTYLQSNTPSPEEAEILQLWGETLNALEQAPVELFGKVDWVTKKCLMDHYLKKAGLDWECDLRDQPAYYELLRMDIQYHNLAPQEGLFYRLLHGRLDSMASDDEIHQAGSMPPSYTRARIRGDIIAAARRNEMRVEVDKWDGVYINGYEVTINDPLDFVVPEIFMLLKNGGIEQEQRSLEILSTESRQENPHTELQHQTDVLPNGEGYAVLDQLRGRYELVISTSDPTAARQLSQALESLGYQPAHIESTPNPSFNIRWQDAPDEMINEIASTICRILDLSQTEISRYPGWLFPHTIFINLPL